MNKTTMPTEDDRDLLALRKALAGMTKASDRRAVVTASTAVAEALSRTISSTHPLMLLSAKSEIEFAIDRLKSLPSHEQRLDLLVFAYRMVEGASCVMAKRTKGPSDVAAAA